MSKLKISKGYRKFLRQEKAKIRRRVFDLSEEEKLIKDLYQEIFKNESYSKGNS